MKKLLVAAVLALGAVGCQTACQDSTVLFACKSECCTEKPKKCNCNEKGKCCEAAKKAIVVQPQ